MRRLFLLGLFALAACGTPQERCISNVTKDIRVLDRLIAETQKNLDRGYAIRRENYIVYEREICGKRNGKNIYCTFPETETRQYPVSIDLVKEKAKLDSQLAKRSQLAKTASSGINVVQISISRGLVLRSRDGIN